MLDAENIYRRIGRLIETAPASPTNSQLSPDLLKWCGQALAAVQLTGDLLLKAEITVAIDGLQANTRAVAFQKIMMVLYKALALAEIHAPAGAQGAFIPVGNSFDAFAAVAKVFGAATEDIFLVDPYMDESVLLDFGGSVPDGVSLRLLTDKATVKSSLVQAAGRWKEQYKSHSFGLRFALPRALHDRSILIDGIQAWSVTQSLKDLAKRSPAEIVRADDTALLKIAAYEDIWTKAEIVV